MSGIGRPVPSATAMVLAWFPVLWAHNQYLHCDLFFRLFIGALILLALALSSCLHHLLQPVAWPIASSLLKSGQVAIARSFSISDGVQSVRFDHCVIYKGR